LRDPRKEKNWVNSIGFQVRMVFSATPKRGKGGHAKKDRSWMKKEERLYLSTNELLLEDFDRANGGGQKKPEFNFKDRKATAETDSTNRDPILCLWVSLTRRQRKLERKGGPIYKARETESVLILAR